MQTAQDLCVIQHLSCAARSSVATPIMELLHHAGPLSQQTVEFVHDFRLDEKLAESIASVSLVAAAVVGTAVAGLTAFLLQQGFTAAVRMQLSAAMLAGEICNAALGTCTQQA